MDKVRSLLNQYVGINAHLHSKFQNAGGWDDFHAAHIPDLAKVMKAQLRSTGYTAGIEKSLQIRHGAETVRSPESDVTIFDTDPNRIKGQRGIVTATYDLVLPIPIMLDVPEVDLKEYHAIGIRKSEPESDELGEAVAWVELLSPSNKPGGRHTEAYRQKRLDLLETGLVFVEIDYLHQSPSPLEGIATYARRGKNPPFEPGAHAYRIAVIDPRPAIWDGQAHLRQFDVDDQIPTLDIPLNAGDIFTFDFGISYNKTFNEMLYGDEVDYRQLPAHFEAYSEFDQTRIVARMLTILDAAQRGQDLEKGVLDMKTVSLADGLQQLKQLGVSV